ncbi:MAG: acyltransferase [Anaerolineales bacterium]|jgi:acetyltransferase-like isoleucine patch superfamily enzyme
MSLNDSFSRVLRLVRKLLHGGTFQVEKSIRGQGNVFDAKSVNLSEVRLDIIGDNNRIRIGAGCVLSNVYFRIRGSGHQIEFGDNCRISRGAVLWFEDRAGVLQVGSGTTMVEVHIAVTENSKVIIGEDCMFANDIDIRTGDSHSVINAQSGERLNYAEDVVISRHVWIAPHTVILKGVTIGENSIIATGAVLTKSCEPGVIMGGNPAKVIKTGVSWKRERLVRD